MHCSLFVELKEERQNGCVIYVHDAQCYNTHAESTRPDAIPILFFYKKLERTTSRNDSCASTWYGCLLLTLVLVATYRTSIFRVQRPVSTLVDSRHTPAYRRSTLRADRSAAIEGMDGACLVRVRSARYSLRTYVFGAEPWGVRVAIST